jgi:hypothetical protein
MQALLFFYFLFCCTALLYLHLLFSSLFLSKVPQNHNTIQTNQQISYQPNIDSLLNIVQLIWQSKHLEKLKCTTAML